MAHLSSLSAAFVAQSLHDYADMITSTSKKSSRGYRAGVIISYRYPIAELGRNFDLDVPLIWQSSCRIWAVRKIINLLGSPSNLRKSIALRFTLALHKSLRSSIHSRNGSYGMKASFLLVVPIIILFYGIFGQQVFPGQTHDFFHKASITLNKNVLHGDEIAINPGGVYFCPPFNTSRGMVQAHFGKSAVLFSMGIEDWAISSIDDGEKARPFQTCDT